ncbi:hypothetical protein [Streptomyces sp. ALI-76-A]|uniref:hypothetical protein n=1 Tax=Streptomyces sp. ALI-76-A TaxID=3025736 RepID=UPI00256F4F4D|nr:hypothetical protein [Streptomyces sp. ALI-76-A]MDL5202499.1 hypothetical protein [Streptomyces sp. ALI-76-A]
MREEPERPPAPDGADAPDDSDLLARSARDPAAFVLAGPPYLRLVGPVHDSAGRSGVAIEYDGEDIRSRVVIDPKTALPMEERYTTLGGPRDGDLVSGVTYLSLRPVRDAPEAVPHEDIPPDPDNPLDQLGLRKR